MGYCLNLMRVGRFIFYPKNWMGYVLVCQNMRVGHVKLNETCLPVIFSGSFLISDPWKLMGSLSVCDDFSLDYLKLH